MIESFTKALQLAPRYLAVIAISCGVYLFAPEEWIAKLGLDNLDQKYRPYIGGVFLVSSGVVVVAIVRWIAMFGWACIHVRGIKRKVIKRLNSLTEDEKQILRFYISQQTRANTLRVDDGIVQGLVSAGIIYRSTQIGNMLEGFSYNIQDFAWEHLHEHPNLLIGSTNTYRTDRSNLLRSFDGLF
jgi:hypothetical protein